MKRVNSTPRPGWKAFAESVGFNFHTFDGEPYWDETAYYQFNLHQIENDLEAPTEELHQMTMDMVGDITRSEEMLTQLNIPRDFWSYIWNSWNKGEPHLYGRMDLVYNGFGPAKLLELNYDTPTSLFETGFFQWVWLEDQIRNDHFYDWILYAVVLLQYGSLYLFLSSISESSGFDLMGQIISMGILCGTFGINVAHELGHRKSVFEQFLAKLLLLTSLYTHFFIEHNKGHHKNVATHEDPSSARFNESVFAFYPRTLLFTYLSAWKIANADVQKKGKSK